MSLLVFSDVVLPEEYVTQPGAILARRGAGKTYTAMRIVEQLVEHRLPCVVLDPLGVAWGLRSSASGKREGLPVTILGGDHGDIPLEPTGGKVVAQFIVDHPGAYVVDMSAFESNSAQDRFAADFAEALYRAKGRDRSPLHLIVDEADSFAPQRPGKSQLRMLGAFEAIVRRGRSRGLGCTLISQRPAVLNKNVLSQIEVLVALQVTAPQDRKALDEWAQGYSTPEQRREFLDALAVLEIGEAWVWSPQWLRVFQRTRVSKRRTFDSSSTPVTGDDLIEPVALADVDLDALKAAMSDTIERARADDPKVLRVEIARLQAEVGGLRAETTPTVDLDAVRAEAAEETRRAFVKQIIRVVDEGRSILEVFDGTIDRLRAVRDGIETVVGRFDGELDLEPEPRGPRGPGSGICLNCETEWSTEDEMLATGHLFGSPCPRRTSDHRPPAPDRATLVTEPREAGDYAPRAGARRMLAAIALYPDGLTVPQIGTFAKVKHTGGTFSTYLSELRRNGLIEETGDGRYRATDTGRVEADVAEMPSDAAALRVEWRARLKAAGAKRMFDRLVDRYPDWVSRAALADWAGIAVAGGTFSTYLSRLRANRLIEEDGARIRAHPDLMGDRHGTPH